MGLFFALFGVAIGVWLAYSFALPPMLGVAVFALLGAVVAFRRKKALVYLLAVAVGLVGQSISFPAQAGIGEHSGVVYEVKSNYFFFESFGTRYYVYEKDNRREAGDWLRIYGKCADYVTTTYESRFSFAEYLSRRGISKQLNAYKTTDLFLNPVRLREKEEGFLAHFSADARTLIDSLLFNRRDSSSDLLAEASSIGLLYFLSASGILFSTFLRLIEKVAFLRMNENGSKTLALLAGLCFLPIGFVKIGIMRVLLVRGIGLINKCCLAKRYGYLEILSLSGLVLFALDRHCPLSMGFLGGFGLAFLLLFSREALKWLKKPAQGPTAGAVAYLAIMPNLLSNGVFHVFGYLYSFLVLPVVVPFVLISLISFLSVPLPWILNPYALFIAQEVRVLAKADIALPIGDFGWALSAAYYLLLIAILFFLEIGWERMGAVLSAALVGLFAISALPISAPLTEEVDFINVGQGDAILIRDGMSNVMIDTGGNLSFDLAQEVDIPYFRKSHVYRIDCLIASHGDYDHIGAKDSLAKHFPVSRCVSEAKDFPLKIGRLEFTNYNVYGGTEENEESLVLGLNFMGKKWLFAGDAPMQIEQKIIAAHPELDCDILKLGHHGSKTSSSLEFLRTVSPEVAIISVGAKNSYGHPDDAVIARLSGLGIAIRRTDLEGTISYRRLKRFAL